jgi:hypothetical protein
MNVKVVRVTKRQGRDAELDELIDKIESQTSLAHWNSLVSEVDVPPEIAVAFMTMRPELINLAKPRDLTAKEAADLYRIIKVLMETNYALQQHAKATAKMVQHWAGTFKGMQSTVERIENFANFRTSDQYEDDSEE